MTQRLRNNLYLVTTSSGEDRSIATHTDDNTTSGDVSKLSRSQSAIEDMRSVIEQLRSEMPYDPEIEELAMAYEALILADADDDLESEAGRQRPAVRELDTSETRDHTPAMNDITDYRHELKLRDDSLRKELDLRQESFRAEQAVRDKALEDKFSGFFTAQAERDRAFEKVSDARFDRIEKDIASIKSDSKTITSDVQGIKVTMAKYLGAAVVVGALASGILGAALKHLLP